MTKYKYTGKGTIIVYDCGEPIHVGGDEIVELKEKHMGFIEVEEEKKTETNKKKIGGK